MDARNGTLNKDYLGVPFREPISEQTYESLNLVFNLIANPILGLAGILLNIINMAVFYKMGLSDGVTQNFFILAFSDGLFATTSMVNKLVLILRTLIIIIIIIIIMKIIYIAPNPLKGSRRFTKSVTATLQFT